jgi:hypothetical protein
MSVGGSTVWLMSEVQVRGARDPRDQLEFGHVDTMSDRQFEEFCVWLLQMRGYQKVARTGGRRRTAGIDVVATAPEGTPAAFRCVRSRDSVGPEAVRELRAASTTGRYAGRDATVVTNALVSPDAWAVAAGSGITVADRTVLRHWMSQARSAIEAGAEVRPAGPRPTAKIATPIAIGTGCLAALAVAVVSVVEIQATASSPGKAASSSPGKAAVSVAIPSAAAGPIRTAPVVAQSPLSPAAVPSPRSTPSAGARGSQQAVPGPAVVVTEFFTAISRHDWQQVWRLGGQELGYGPYATYSGMISGYRTTARDVVTALHASGPTVTGRFLAYQTTGAVRTYQFSYVVRGGVIASGYQELIG